MYGISSGASLVSGGSVDFQGTQHEKDTRGCGSFLLPSALKIPSSLEKELAYFPGQQTPLVNLNGPPVFLELIVTVCHVWTCGNQACTCHTHAYLLPAFTLQLVFPRHYHSQNIWRIEWANASGTVAFVFVHTPTGHKIRNTCAVWYDPVQQFYALKYRNDVQFWLKVIRSFSCWAVKSFY